MTSEIIVVVNGSLALGKESREALRKLRKIRIPILPNLPVIFCLLAVRLLLNSLRVAVIPGSLAESYQFWRFRLRR